MFLQNATVTSFYIFCPGGLSIAKVNKTDSAAAFTKFWLIQSHFKWVLSSLLLILGFSLLYDPDIFWKNASITPKEPEWDWVRPSNV